MMQQLEQCLFDEMKLLENHWMKQYRSFDSNQIPFIEATLNQMFKEAKKIKTQALGDTKLRDTVSFNGDDASNEFIHVMCCCFEEWIEHDGVELQKALYKHNLRNTDDWFPVVLITQQINEMSFPDEQITVYRGCHNSQLGSDVYRNRQSWTTSLEEAKNFAFSHPSDEQHRQESFVLKATVARTDILWDRGHESEMVLKIGFTPCSIEVMKIAYDDYNCEQNIAIYDSTLAV